ncbi:MAG: nucleotidyltransferase family protein [Candidatus Sumerlaeaceae bacterium]|nr:nucleotidyltransferase family protein [Candidatus Sumerlaeaceae bacterium]
MSDIHAVILASGISSRMGFPKALMPVGNKFFLLKIFDTLTDAKISPAHIVINMGLKSSLAAQMEKFPGAEFVLNDQPAKGQIHSLQLGLEQAEKSGAKAAVVALVDQPFVKIDTILMLLDAAESLPQKILVPRRDGAHGHPILIPAVRFGDFINAPDGKTARDVLEEHQADVAYVDVDDAGAVTDVDTPEDIAKFLKAEEEELD